jgi:DNA invertase Pin-like site-specific DNA recombinase
VLPAIVYAARSAPERDEGARSTDSQVATVVARISKEGGRVIVGEPFTEDGFSGSRRSRGPALEAAIRAAVAAADEHGSAELWAFHSSRFGRGSGKKGEARAIGKLFYDMRAHGVALRTVEDDEFVTNEMLIGFASRQASKYAEDLGAHVRRGITAAAAAGTPMFSIIPDGYMYVYKHDDAGRVIGRTMPKNPERRAIYDLHFELFRAGWSDVAIAEELGRRGYMTNPQKRTHRPRKFDPNRVANTLTNPTYAGLVVLNGEIVGKGQWDPYIDPDEWRKLMAARAERNGPRNPRGRPPEGYLLSRLAVCGVCGSPLHAYTERRYQGARRYLCSGRRAFTGSCSFSRVDARMIDAAFADNLESFLTDVDGWRDRLAVDRKADIARMTGEVERATTDLAAVDRRIATTRRRYDAALDAGDDDRADAIEGAMTEQRADRERAQRRLTAAQTALADATAAGPVGDPSEAFLATLRVELHDRAGDRKDIKRLNTVIRDYFDRVVLTPTDDGGVIVAPVLSATVARRIFEDIGAWQNGAVELVRPGDPDFDPADIVSITAEAIEPGEKPFTGWARVRQPAPITTNGAESHACKFPFSEVKSRRGRGDPWDALHDAKRAQVRRMARAYLSETPDRPRARLIRFDAIGVVVDGRGNLTRLDHLEDAF